MFRLKLFLISLLALGILTGCQSPMTGKFVSENQSSCLILGENRTITADNGLSQTQGTFYNILEQHPEAKDDYETNDYYAQFTLNQNQQGVYPDPLIGGDFIVLLTKDSPYRLTPVEPEAEQYSITETSSGTTISWEMPPYSKTAKLGEQLYYNAIASTSSPYLAFTRKGADQSYTLTLTLPGNYQPEGQFYISDNGDFYTFVKWGQASPSFTGIYYRQGAKSILQLTSLTENNYSGKLPSLLYNNETTTSYFEPDNSSAILDLPLILNRNKDYLSVSSYYPGENYSLLYAEE